MWSNNSRLGDKNKNDSIVVIMVISSTTNIQTYIHVYEVKYRSLLTVKLNAKVKPAVQYLLYLQKNNLFPIVVPIIKAFQNML